MSMDNDMKILLEQKKLQLRIKQEKAEIQHEKENIIQNVVHFSQKYRFADEVEGIKIQSFISKLNFLSPGQLYIKENCAHFHNNVYLCFLMGSHALLKIYIYGKYHDIINDYDEWEFFSPCLLLVDEDFTHFAYINDGGQITESQIFDFG